MFGNSNAFPLSDRFIESAFVPKGRKNEVLKMMAGVSRQATRYDFDVKAIDSTNQWTITNTSTSTQWAVLAEPGGWIRGVTGASVATAALQLSIPTKYWNGTAGAGFASRIRLSAVTDIRVEQGFADVLPAIGTTVVNTASAAFNSTTVAAVYLYDNGVSASTTVTGLYTVGASIAYSAVATTTNRYASGTSLFVALEVYGQTARLWLGDGGPAVAVKTLALEAATGLIPFINIKGLGASKNVDVDTIWTWTVNRV